MARAALTLWFTLTALAGPGVCCCGVTAAVAKPAEPTVPPPAPKPVKTCCHREAPPPAQPDPPPADPHQHPAKPCPCGHDRPAATAPAPADVAAQLKLFETLPVAHLAPATVADAVVVRRPDPLQHVPKPAGRDLLTAYSLLRC